MHFCLWYLFPLGLNMAREYIYIYFLYPTGESIYGNMATLRLLIPTFQFLIHKPRSVKFI